MEIGEGDGERRLEERREKEAEGRGGEGERGSRGWDAS